MKTQTTIDRLILISLFIIGLSRLEAQHFHLWNTRQWQTGPLARVFVMNEFYDKVVLRVSRHGTPVGEKALGPGDYKFARDYGFFAYRQAGIALFPSVRSSEQLAKFLFCKDSKIKRNLFGQMDYDQVSLSTAHGSQDVETQRWSLTCDR